MLYLRALIFTILVPGFVAGWAPWMLLASGHEVRAFDAGPWRWAGLAAIVAGAAGYLLCAADFVLKGGGTPAIWFTRPLRFLLGEEPRAIVQQGLYRYSRNPMYLSVAAVVFGEGWFFGSALLLLYGVAVFIFFHLIVVLVEEPHLRRKGGPSYIEYCRRTPRWIGKSHGSAMR
ncbi:MAG: isoprenylcysteine carboxylmethyltransferase family protein [Bryobacteraceae bacterium]|jgi:protein-S-isoprenylcysteine O-methyltransferase Ste14